MMGHGGMGFGLIGFLIMLLFWGALIVGAVWLVKALIGGHSSSIPPGDDLTAREILDLRYARGEITRQQYEIMKKDLD